MMLQPLLRVFREKAVEAGVYAVRDGLEVFRVVLEVKLVTFYDEEFAGVVGYPGLVAVIEAGEVFKAYGLLVVPSALLDLGYQAGYGGADVDEQVRQLNH